MSATSVLFIVPFLKIAEILLYIGERQVGYARHDDEFQRRSEPVLVEPERLAQPPFHLIAEDRLAHLLGHHQPEPRRGLGGAEVEKQFSSAKNRTVHLERLKFGS